MFHYFHWTIKQFGDQTYIVNDTHGIQIHYKKPVIARIDSDETIQDTTNNKKSNSQQPVACGVFIHPHIDDNHKTIRYYAFDTHEQKNIFENLLKITGIGPKTAFHIAQLDQESMKSAIKELDVKFFQNIPGIWPKSAKKILLELKDSIKQDELVKLAVDEKLLKKISSTLKWLGYEAKKIHYILHKYNKPISEENLSEVIKWIIKHI
jgi:Holliday junction DNA helicase RuvA